MSTIYLRDRWFEDLPVGEFHVFGSHTFSELEIVEFAETFDPRPQSTDPFQARFNHRQGLVASPWLITAMWMRKMVDYMEVYAQGVNDGRRNGAGVPPAPFRRQGAPNGRMGEVCAESFAHVLARTRSP